MKAPLKVTLDMVITDADGAIKSETHQVYHGCDLENVVDVEQAVAGSLLALGKRSLEAKAPGKSAAAGAGSKG